MWHDHNAGGIHDLARVQYQDEGKAGGAASEVGTGKVADVPGDADAAVHQAAQQTEGHTHMDSIPLGEDARDNSRRLHSNGYRDRAARQTARTI